MSSDTPNPENSLERIFSEFGRRQAVLETIAETSQEPTIKKMAQSLKEVNEILGGILPDIVESALSQMKLRAQVETLKKVLTSKDLITQEDLEKVLKETLQQEVERVRASKDSEK